MKIVCLGDLHIPERKKEIPPVFSKSILELSPDLVLSTGDHTEYESLKRLEKFGPVVAVNGNMEFLGLERVRVVEAFPGVKILLLHGDQFGRGNTGAVAGLAKKMGCKIAVSGHTHIFEARETSGVLCVNPGTATGAFGTSDTQEESLALLELNVHPCEKQGVFEVKVTKLSLDKKRAIVKTVVFSENLAF